MLSVEGVVKRYDSVTAVDDISFQAHPGRVLGLLGPNGAGKTSTIRMITYITAPDDGQITLDQKKVGIWSQACMGYLPEERGLYPKLKVGEQLLYLAELKGLPRAEARARLQTWADRFGAAEWLGKKTEELSKGMQQKVQFISTIIHEPKLLILDEPFGGLDPINAELLKQVMLDLKQDGRIILFASHRMEQVEQLCDDICLISRGSIVLDGPLQEVKQSFGRDSVVLEYAGPDSFLDAMADSNRIRVTSRNPNRVELKLLNGTAGREVLASALDHAVDIYRFERQAPSLNEIFVSVVEEHG